MPTEEELQRQIGINLRLRRQLETARRDAVEYCAKFCEEHEAGMSVRDGWSLSPRTDHMGTHPGDAYAKGLRAIIKREE